jgi:hypothetical protein
MACVLGEGDGESAQPRLWPGGDYGVCILYDRVPTLAERFISTGLQLRVRQDGACDGMYKREVLRSSQDGVAGAARPQASNETMSRQLRQLRNLRQTSSRADW